MKQGKKRAKVFLGAACAALLAIVAVPSKKGADTPQAEFAPAAHLTIAEVPADGVDSERMAEQRQRSEQLTWGRNPFLAPVAAAEATPSTAPLSSTGTMQLTGISLAGDTRMAIIDHEVVQRGDQLTSGHTVETITAGTVTLLLDGVETRLSLGGER